MLLLEQLASIREEGSEGKLVSELPTQESHDKCDGNSGRLLRLLPLQYNWVKNGGSGGSPVVSGLLPHSKYLSKGGSGGNVERESTAQIILSSESGNEGMLCKGLLLQKSIFNVFGSTGKVCIWLA